MFNILIQNLEITGLSFFIFSICVSANIIIKTFYNCNDHGEQFDYKKLLSGFLRMLTIGLTTGMLSIVISMAPSIPVLGDMFQTDEIREVFSNGAVLALYAKSILIYFKKAYVNVNKAMSDENALLNQK